MYTLTNHILFEVLINKSLENFGQKFLVYVFGAGCAKILLNHHSMCVFVCWYIGCIVGYVVVALQNNDDWEKGEGG